MAHYVEAGGSWRPFWLVTAVLETLTAIRRAGAGTVLTYWAVEAARWVR